MQPGPTDQFGNPVNSDTQQPQPQPQHAAPAPVNHDSQQPQYAAPAQAPAHAGTYGSSGAVVIQQGGGGGAGKIILIIVLVLGAIILIPILFIVLSGVLYVWSNSLAEDQSGGDLDFHTWSGEDAMGEGNLVEIGMTSGDAINWAVIDISISIDGGTTMVCPYDDAAASCSYTTYQGAGNDQAWETSEGIIISGTCDDAAGCYVDATITEAGRVIGTVTAYADSTE
jgi:hypothetical protein